MDERVKVGRDIQGQPQVRVDRLVVEAEGLTWLYQQLHDRDLKDLGEPITRGRHIIIPIRKDTE
jgi:hypothetical protein